MTEDTPLYNTRIIRSYVEYLKRYFPDIDVVPLLKYAEIETFQLDDEGHWLTQEQVDRFHEILEKTTHDPEIPRKVGRFSVTSQAAGALGKYLMGLINPASAYSVLGKINSRVSRATRFETRSLGPEKLEAKVFLKPGVAEKPYQCKTRLGLLEALAKLFTYDFAAIEHPVCIHKGGDFCQYIITWEKPSSYLWKRIRNYSFIIGFFICLILIGFIKPAYWVVIILSYVLATMSVTLYVEYLEKNNLLANINSEKDAAESLMDQINSRYNEALLIQEVGQTASMISEIDKLLYNTLKSIIERMAFDRGMILLANKQKDLLVYAVSYGYTPKDEGYMKDIEFHLDNPHSKGTAVVAFKTQKPILVNDIYEIENDVSSRSLDFIRAMGSQSFICCPIVYKNESMGVLLVDNVQSKKPLGQTEISLLMGIAPQIGVSINNAIAYQKITASEERFRSLSENAPDIIYALGVKGGFTYINPAIEVILGYRAEKMIGKDFINIVKKEDVIKTIQAFKQIRDRKETIKEVMVILLHKDGTERYFSLSGAPNYDAENHFVGVVGTLKNMTEIRQSEMELKKSLDKLQTAMSSTIDAISLIAESRDPYTAGHQRRVAQLAVAIARELQLSEENVELIRMGSLIHDIGKIYLPSEILTKPGRLKPIEFAMMKSHPEVGYKILKKVDFIPAIVDMVYQHHERIDGSGYPLQISGEAILLESRIVSVADVVEAMASHRPYRASLGKEAALMEIKKQRGISFDAKVVDACLKIFDEQNFEFRQDTLSS